MKSLKSFICEYLSIPDNAKAFTIIKPGFVKYRDEIIKYTADKGFIMCDHTEDQVLSDEQVRKLYDCHKNEDWYEDLCKYMTSGPVESYVWGFDHDKFPRVNTIALMKEIKYHFRDKYGKDDMRNCMHSSDSLDNVQREANICMH